MKELAGALDRKINIVDQAANKTINDYNFTETVEVKHRHKVGPFWGDPTYSYHEEWRFRHDKYHKDLGDVNAEIEKCLSVINHLSDTITVLKSKELDANENLAEQKRLENLLIDTQNQLTNVKAQLTSYINTLNDTQRACLLASEFDNGNAIFLLEAICEKSFDPNILATIAIEQGKMNLLNFAINAGANLDANYIEEKTLIQYAVRQGNQDIINKIISSTTDFDNSLLSAISANDLTTIKIILSSYPELASRLLAGESSVLHYAIANKQMDIIHYIVAKYPQSLKTLNNNGDSSIAIAKRSNNENLSIYISEQLDKDIMQKNHILDNSLILKEIELSCIYENIDDVDVSGAVGKNELDLI